MSSSGGGPGRGRSRGRARARGQGPPPQARRPGEVADEGAPREGAVGRGRGRAQRPAQEVTQAPPTATISPPATAEPPTEEMKKLTVQPNGKSRDVARPQRRRFDEAETMKTRPEHITNKTGSSGTPIPLKSNHFILKTATDKPFFQYQVDYDPPVDNRRLRIALMWDLKDIVGQTRVFDGMVLYLPIRLDPPQQEHVVKLKDGSPVTVCIKMTGEIAARSPQCVHLYNVLFRKILSNLKMEQLGRNYFSQAGSITIPQHKLELWPGYSTSILAYEECVMLCADVQHKVLRMDTVLDFLYELYEQRHRSFHEEATKKLVGEIVMTRYNNKTYRIDDINWEMNPKSKFKGRDGSEQSFVEYYAKVYDKKITDMDQPLLVSRPKKSQQRQGITGPLLLIPELCTRTGLGPETLSDFRVMKDLSQYTRSVPQDRSLTLKNFMKTIYGNPDIVKMLKDWNVEFAKDLTSLDGRVLPQEKIFQKDSQLRYDPASADWSRGMRGNHLISAVGLQNFMVISTQRDSQLASDFVQTLQKVGPPMGIRVNNPDFIGLKDDRTETFLNAIKSKMRDNTQMVICILPSNRKDRYDAIKKYCCVESPVPSQVVVARTLTKKNAMMSVTTKVAMQLNCKLGGELWALEIPLKGLMVIGIDSYHDSSARGKSAGGFVASVNSTLTRYFCQCMFQHPGQELGDNFKTAMIAALKKYHEVNQALPDRVVVYRDGVGDGQLPLVVEHEIPQFHEAFKNVGSTYKPKFSVVVVKKRIITRIFRSDQGRVDNPPPGTIVDSMITKPEWYDFFLVSQSVNQGTVSPTHFNVVVDGGGLKPDHMQRLTYKLCHLYYNWPGTVRVPAPCQYAHKLAFLVGQSIHREPAAELADRLYFL